MEAETNINEDIMLCGHAMKMSNLDEEMTVEEAEAIKRALEAKPVSLKEILKGYPTIKEINERNPI